MYIVLKGRLAVIKQSSAVTQAYRKEEDKRKSKLVVIDEQPDDNDDKIKRHPLYSEVRELEDILASFQHRRDDAGDKNKYLSEQIALSKQLTVSEKRYMEKV